VEKGVRSDGSSSSSANRTKGMDRQHSDRLRDVPLMKGYVPNNGGSSPLSFGQEFERNEMRGCMLVAINVGF